MKGPKILFLDIETAPILGYVWGLYDQTVGINQIKSDWHILSWSAKWAHDKKIMYQDQRKEPNIENDKKLLKDIWELLDKADVVVAHNGKSFDIKKLNARFIIHGYQPPTKYKVVDTKVIAKQHLGLTSNKLEYIAEALNTKYKKLKTKKFPGFDLWRECLRKNKAAWKEMEKYNKLDVLTLEEVYKKLVPWDNSINPNLYHDDDNILCTCGSEEFVKRGFFYTGVGKYQRYKCKRCGAETRSRDNLLSKEKRKSLRVRTV